MSDPRPKLGGGPSGPTEAQWLGLLAVTESALPHEWPLILWAVRNRMASPRWPNEAREVVLQPWQFSRFNDWQALRADQGDAAVYAAGCKWAEGQGLETHQKAATACAVEVLGAMPWSAPFSRRVVFYYSPRSMKPAGKVPSWWAEEVAREFTPPGVDPQRWVFGEARHA